MRIGDYNVDYVGNKTHKTKPSRRTGHKPQGKHKGSNLRFASSPRSSAPAHPHVHSPAREPSVSNTASHDFWDQLILWAIVIGAGLFIINAILQIIIDILAAALIAVSIWFIFTIFGPK